MRGSPDRIGYVGVNGSVGTVHLLSHDPGADLIRFFERVRPILQRDEVTDIWVSGHTHCAGAPRLMNAFLDTVRKEAERRGKAFLLRPAACSYAGEDQLERSG